MLALGLSPEVTMMHRLLLLSNSVTTTVRFVVSCLWIECFWTALRLHHLCQALFGTAHAVGLWWFDSLLMPYIPILEGGEITAAYASVVLSQLVFAASFSPTNRRLVASACRSCCGLEGKSKASVGASSPK